MSKARNTADQINRVNSSAADATAITIDSSENVLVGKTSTAFGTAGTMLYPNGEVNIVKSGLPLYVHRLGSDGEVIRVVKDNSTVGSIGTSGGDLIIGTGDTGLKFFDGGDSIFPVDQSTGNNRDNAVDIGYPSVRFKDLYLSGGVYLGGTGAANKLTDYEFGSVALTMGGSSSNPSSTQSTTAHYTKIGNVVTVWFKFSNQNTSGVSGNVEVNGLPFTVTAAVGDGYGSAWGGRDSGGADGQKIWQALNNTTAARMLDGGGNVRTWASAGTGTYQGGFVIYRTS